MLAIGKKVKILRPGVLFGKEAVIRAIYPVSLLTNRPLKNSRFILNIYEISQGVMFTSSAEEPFSANELKPVS